MPLTPKIATANVRSYGLDMGKRSRHIEARRQMRCFLDHLDHHTRLIDTLKLEFCRMAAAFADCRGHEAMGSPTATAWLSSNFQLSEPEAAICITFGRYLTAVDSYRAEKLRRTTPIED